MGSDEADLLFAGEDEPVEAAPLEAASDESGEDNELDDVQPTGLRQGLDDRHDAALESGTAGFDPVEDLDFDHDELDAAIANAMTSGDTQDLPDDHEQAWAQPEAAPAAPPAGPREDPLDVIAALTAKYSAPISAASYGRTNAAPVEDAPDIETVEVQDKAVALADDLDIPELAYEEEPSPAPHYDDIDSEFASLLTTMNGDTASPEAAAADVRTDDPDHDAWRGAAGGYDYAPAADPVQPTHAAYDDDAQGGYGYDEATRMAGRRPPTIRKPKPATTTTTRISTRPWPRPNDRRARAAATSRHARSLRLSEASP